MRNATGPARSYEESCALLDQIVGRCVRDAEFASAVLADPEAALSEYGLNEDELDDFRALRDRHCDEAAEGWAAIRVAMGLLEEGRARCRGGMPQPSRLSQDP